MFAIRGGLANPAMRAQCEKRKPEYEGSGMWGCGCGWGVGRRDISGRGADMIRRKWNVIPVEQQNPRWRGSVVPPNLVAMCCVKRFLFGHHLHDSGFSSESAAPLHPSSLHSFFLFLALSLCECVFVHAIARVYFHVSKGYKYACVCARMCVCMCACARVLSCLRLSVSCQVVMWLNLWGRKRMHPTSAKQSSSAFPSHINDACMNASAQESIIIVFAAAWFSCLFHGFNFLFTHSYFIFLN